ncbi:MAG: hypothetical protein ABSG79_11305 [Bryobacteraceae bacterium]|jgi:hypothetical protein
MRYLDMAAAVAGLCAFGLTLYEAFAKEEYTAAGVCFGVFVACCVAFLRLRKSKGGTGAGVNQTQRSGKNSVNIQIAGNAVFGVDASKGSDAQGPKLACEFLQVFVDPRFTEGADGETHLDTFITTSLAITNKTGPPIAIRDLRLEAVDTNGTHYPTRNLSAHQRTLIDATLRLPRRDERGMPHPSETQIHALLNIEACKGKRIELGEACQGWLRCTTDHLAEAKIVRLRLTVVDSLGAVHQFETAAPWITEGTLSNEPLP